MTEKESHLPVSAKKCQDSTNKIFKVSKTSRTEQARLPSQSISLRKHRKVIQKKSKPDLADVDPISIEDPESEYPYKCGYCDRSFKKSVSLGGHISKAHNGKSDHYKKKMEIRESRNQDREFLAQAKTVFKEQTGMNPKEYRNVITRIKNELAKGQNAKLIVKSATPTLKSN